MVVGCNKPENTNTLPTGEKGKVANLRPVRAESDDGAPRGFCDQRSDPPRLGSLSPADSHCGYTAIL